VGINDTDNTTLFVDILGLRSFLVFLVNDGSAVNSLGASLLGILSEITVQDGLVLGLGLGWGLWGDTEGSAVVHGSLSVVLAVCRGGVQVLTMLGSVGITGSIGDGALMWLFAVDWRVVVVGLLITFVELLVGGRFPAMGEFLLVGEVDGLGFPFEFDSLGGSAEQGNNCEFHDY